MKKVLQLFTIIALLAFGIMIVTIKQKERDSRPFKALNFKSSISVHNKTNYERMDTICLVLADKIFALDSARIYILPLQDKYPNHSFYGVTQQLHFDAYIYYIYVSESLSLEKLKIVLSHEFVHVNQFKRGDLVYRAPHYYWKGKLIAPVTPYKQRAYEIEAFTSQRDICKRLNTLLY